MLENFDVTKIKIDDELYPEKIRRIINPPKQIYVARKYRFIKGRCYFCGAEVGI